MNKRVLIPVLIVLAAVIGYAAITMMPNKPKAETPPVANEPAMEQKAPAGQPEKMPGKGETQAEKPKSVEQKKADKPAADAKKPVAKNVVPRADQADRPAGSRRMAAMHVMRMAMNISELEKSGNDALKPDQAKKILAILTPLRSKPKLTEAEADKALAALTKVFTADQLKAMTPSRPDSRPGDRPGQRPADGAGTQRPPREGMQGERSPQGAPPPSMNDRRPPDRNAMQDFNPFYAKAFEGQPRAEQMLKRMNELFVALEKTAKSA